MVKHLTYTVTLNQLTNEPTASEQSARGSETFPCTVMDFRDMSLPEVSDGTRRVALLGFGSPELVADLEQPDFIAWTFSGCQFPEEPGATDEPLSIVSTSQLPERVDYEQEQIRLPEGATWRHAILTEVRVVDQD